MKKYDYKNLTSSTDLITIAKRDLGIDIQVFSRDDGPTVYENGFYIINLDDSDGQGSHWIAMIKVNDTTILYMDSYGFPAPVEQLQAAFRDDDKVFYNKRQIQDLKSILCGYYCLAFFKYFKQNPPKGKSSEAIKKPLQGFAAMFSDNPKKNDAILKKYL